MSNKPLKKSDSDKAWRKPRCERPRMISPEYHLIVTEGTKTEPYYFEGLRNEINFKYPGYISIKIEGVGQGANTLTLLDRAEKIVRTSATDYKHVWLVYDRDDFPRDDFDNTYFKCLELSNDSPVTYHALWSNECIEYWFLLHFKYLDSALHRSQYFPKLTECLGFTYKKNRNDIYDLLKPHMIQAINNAKNLLDSYGKLPPSQCTPGTNVYEIFEKLQDYLK